MVVNRIVHNIQAEDCASAQSFYGDLLGLVAVMDLGWIRTYQAADEAPVQISIASEGGSGTMVPKLSIEVDDVDAIYQLAKSAGFQIVYDITDEPWGVRRFYVRDPFGTVVNILSHSD